MPRFNNNNIIIFVINVIMLEFLSALFIHPGALKPLYFFNTSWNTITKASKLFINFFFDYNDVRAFEVFKSIARCIFKCETTKMKLAKNIKKDI